MEKIYSKINKNKLLHIISNDLDENEKRVDLTDVNLPLQVSRINLKESTVRPHNHNPKELFKEKIKPNECWIVLNGKIDISLFDEDKNNIKNTILSKGSILITIDGGHSINKSSQDSELVEIKLGPYKGGDLNYY
jgi:cupin fold WbuC family metalloprotein